jgi:hypothetical protein
MGVGGRVARKTASGKWQRNEWARGWGPSGERMRLSGMSGMSVTSACFQDLICCRLDPVLSFAFLLHRSGTNHRCVVALSEKLNGRASDLGPQKSDRPLHSIIPSTGPFALDSSSTASAAALASILLTHCPRVPLHTCLLLTCPYPYTMCTTLHYVAVPAYAI